MLFVRFIELGDEITVVVKSKTRLQKCSGGILVHADIGCACDIADKSVYGSEIGKLGVTGNIRITVIVISIIKNVLFILGVVVKLGQIIIYNVLREIGSHFCNYICDHTTDLIKTVKNFIRKKNSGGKKEHR